MSRNVSVLTYSLAIIFCFGFLSRLAAADSTVLNTLIAGMADNKFTTHDSKKDADQMELSVGEHFFALEVKRGNGKNSDCESYYISEQSAPLVAFLDQSCEGTPTRKVVGGGNASPVTHDDVVMYDKLSRQFSLFVPAMQQFKKFSPEPSRDYARLSPMIAENRKLLHTILGLMGRTTAVGSNKNIEIRFEFSGGPELVAFSAEQAGQDFANCTYSEKWPEDQLIAIDEDCNGGFDLYENNASGGEADADSIATAEVYKGALLDVERFLSAAAQVFPR